MAYFQWRECLHTSQRLLPLPLVQRHITPLERSRKTTWGMDTDAKAMAVAAAAAVVAASLNGLFPGFDCCPLKRPQHSGKRMLLRWAGRDFGSSIYIFFILFLSPYKRNIEHTHVTSHHITSHSVTAYNAAFWRCLSGSTWNPRYTTHPSRPLSHPLTLLFLILLYFHTSLVWHSHSSFPNLQLTSLLLPPHLISSFFYTLIEINSFLIFVFLILGKSRRRVSCRYPCCKHWWWSF